MEEIKKNEMETMDIKKLSIKVSIPMVISMISIALYSIIDTIFISNIGTNALTAIALVFPIQNLITAIALGIGIGVNSILAKTLGEKNKNKVVEIIIHGIILTFLSWILITILSVIGLNSFFELFTQNGQIKELGYNYLIILSVFSIGSLYQILFEKILEAHGKSKESMIIQIIGAVINLILDPILIFGYFGMPSLGIKGAAISTVIGQIVGALIGIIIIFKNKIIQKEYMKDIKLNRDIIKDIYKVGIPTTILEAIGSIINLILNKILIGFSEAAVSLWGIYEQLQRFVLIIIYGLNYGMIPIIAYNWGAKIRSRVEDCIKFFIKLSIIVTVIGALIFIVFPKEIISFYDITEEILNIGVPAFRILAVSFVFAGISLVLSSTFQAFGNGTYSLIVNLCRKIVIALPIILLLQGIFGIYVIWYAFVIAEILTMLIAIMLFKKIKRNIIEKI